MTSGHKNPLGNQNRNMKKLGRQRLVTKINMFSRVIRFAGNLWVLGL